MHKKTYDTGEESCKKIHIHKAAHDSDWAEIKKLQKDLLAFEKSIRPQRKETNTNGPFDYLYNNIADKNGACFMVSDQGTPVGFISGWIDEGDGLDEGDNRTGYICDCYIVPEYRNKKLFSLLLEEMKNYFRTYNIRKLSTDTLGSNHPMRVVLEKSNFTIHRLIYEMPI